MEIYSEIILHRGLDICIAITVPKLVITELAKVVVLVVMIINNIIIFVVTPETTLLCSKITYIRFKVYQLLMSIVG